MKKNFLRLLSTLPFSICTALAQTDTQNIVLYQNPDQKSTIVTQLSPNNRIIPFYRENDWIKVGLPTNGMVGWVHLPEYIQARENFYRSNWQSVYIQVDNQGKITAYKNGKPLSDEEVKKLAQIQQQNQPQMQELWMEQGAFFNILNQNLNALRALNNGWFNPAVIFLPPDNGPKEPPKSEPPNNNSNNTQNK